MARVAGLLVAAAFFSLLFTASAVKYGLGFAALQWGLAIAMAGVITWAIGAFVTGDWLPFRRL